jgi:hypothetical protein
VKGENEISEIKMSENILSIVSSPEMKRPRDILTRRPLKRKVLPFIPFYEKNGIPLFDDVLVHIMSFLSQREITDCGKVCKDLRRVKQLTRHLLYYFVYNQKMTWHAQRQTDLQAIAINCVRDIQLSFTTLPEYVFIGCNSSFHSFNTYSGLFTGYMDKTIYPNVKTLFIEDAPVSIDWESFPNLEELFILTSQLDLNIDTLWKCRKLRKVIVKIRRGIVYVRDERVTKLPNLEIFAVSGGMSDGDYTTTSSNLHTCIFYSNPTSFSEGVYYETYYSGDDEELFNGLFRAHHKPPTIIINNIKT